MLNCEIKIEAKYFKSFMQELKVKVSNMSPPFQQYGQFIKGETDKQFASETDPDGRKWQPLKPSTLLRKRTSFILRETFEMSKSFFAEATPKSLTYGLRDPKYRFHHTGTSKMVARVVIGDTQARRKVLNKMIVQYLKVKRAGRR